MRDCTGGGDDFVEVSMRTRRLQTARPIFSCSRTELPLWPLEGHRLPRSPGFKRWTFDPVEMLTNVEEFFGHFFGAHAVLVSSGRAAIALTCKHHNLSRGDLVWLPRYTSHCLWNTVGRFGDPTAVFTREVELQVVVHQYGQAHVPRPIGMAKHLVEDSCDSIAKGLALFPNGGSIAIVSLPKVMGVTAGGLLLVRSEQLANDLRLQRDSSAPLTPIDEMVSALRQITNSSRVYDYWDARQYVAIRPSKTQVRQIYSSLGSLTLNAEIIDRRLSELGAVIDLSSEHRSRTRLPSVVNLRAQLQSGCLPSRHVNVNLSDDNQFRKVSLLPLHFGISDADFSHALGHVKESARSVRRRQA